MATITLRPIQRPTFTPPTRMLHPDIPALSANPVLLNNVLAAQQTQRASFGLPPKPISVDDLLDLESGMNLNPLYQLGRHFRTYLCPGVVSANGLVTFSPQRRCVPIRFHTMAAFNAESPPAGGYVIGPMMSGAEQYNAGPGNIPVACYDVQAPDLGMLRPIVTKVGTQVTATSTLPAGHPVGLWCFDLDERGIIAPPMGKPRPWGFQSLAVAAAGGLATFTLNPWKRSRLRRIALDQSQAQFNALTVESITVAGDPQTEAQGSLPGTMFAANGIACNLDGDVCQVGATIAVTVKNNHATLTANVQGELYVDTSDDEESD